MKLLLTAWIALAAQIGIPAQQPRASIEGVVVKLGTGEPLANASVQLNLEEQGQEPTAVPSAVRAHRKTSIATRNRIVMAGSILKTSPPAGTG
jgi:hypothetical protein